METFTRHLETVLTAMQPLITGGVKAAADMCSSYQFSWYHLKWLPIGYFGGIGAFFASYVLFMLARYYSTLHKYKHLPRVTGHAYPQFGQFDQTKGVFQSLFDGQRNPDKPGEFHSVAYWGPSATGEHVVMVNEPSFVRDVAANEKRYPKCYYFYKGLEYVVGRGILTYTTEFDVHRVSRKGLTPVFHMEALKGAHENIVNVSVKKLDVYMDQLKRDGKLEITPAEMEKVTLHAFVDSFFSGEVDHNFINRHVSMIAKLLVSIVFLFYGLAGYARLIPHPALLGLRWHRQQIISYTLDLIKKRKAQVANGTVKEVRNDILGTMMKISGLDDSTIAAEVLTLFVAGSETTSRAIIHTLDLCGRPSGQRAWAKMCEEVDRVLQGRPPSVADMNKLEYTRSLVKESMRHRTPLPGPPRITTKDEVVGGYTIPKGTIVRMGFWNIHRDARWWGDDVNEFKPERFMESSSADLDAIEKTDAKPEDMKFPHNPYAFVPFSAGTRNCIGQKFAMVEAVVIIAMLAQRFTPVVHDPEESWLSFIAAVTPVNLKVDMQPRTTGPWYEQHQLATAAKSKAGSDAGDSVASTEAGTTAGAVAA